jgi:hypothetical protein
MALHREDQIKNLDIMDMDMDYNDDDDHGGGDVHDDRDDLYKVVYDGVRDDDGIIYERMGILISLYALNCYIINKEIIITK